MSLAGLKKYAEWYYTRYFPSRAILREKLMKKSTNGDYIEEVMEALQGMFVEKNIITSYIQKYISQGRTSYFIQQKLRQKKFDTHLVQEVLREFQDMFFDPATYQETLQNRAKKAFQKGISYRKIRYELERDFPDARGVVNEVLNEYDDRYILRTLVVPKLIHVFSHDKIMQKCLQKGFSLSDIRSALSGFTLE